MDIRQIARYRHVWLPLLLLVGLALRAAGIYWGQAYSYFGQGDGMTAYSVAVDFGRGEERAQYIGQPNYNERSKLPGPLWTVWCFLCLRLGGSVYGILWGNALLNVALIYLVCLLAERTAGPVAGFWAALFTATLPWAVYYSVGVYNPDVMGFLGALLCLALWQTVQQDRSRNVAWVVVILLAMPQFHMSGLMLIPAVVIVLLLAPSRVSLPWLLCGLLAGLALYLPYIRGEMAHSWQNTQGMFSGKGGRSWDSLKTLSLPPGLLVNWVSRWTGSMAQYREAGRACFGSFTVLALLNLASGLMAALLILGAFRTVRASAAGFFKAPRKCFGTSPQTLFLALMVLVPLGVSLASGRPFHTRYCLVLLAPLLALVAAGAAQWCGPESARNQRALRGVFLTAALVTTCTNLWFVPALYHYQGARIEQGEVFTPSWKELETVYQSLKAHAGAGRRVEVDDTEYMTALPQQETPARGAGFIRLYVNLREEEAVLVSLQPGSPAIFKLGKAQPVIDPPPAYQRHGIRLTAAGGK